MMLWSNNVIDGEMKTARLDVRAGALPLFAGGDALLVMCFILAAWHALLS
jgi:hypothetical protein